MASENVNAAYNQRANVLPGTAQGRVQRQVRWQRLAAHRTIPVDTRAPSVVQKADEDLKQQQAELGEADDDKSNVPAEAAASGEADRGEADGASSPGAEAPAEPKRSRSARKKA